ncbi:MAG: diguanylate cyclase [Rhodocyclaceae bacterium]
MRLKYFWLVPVVFWTLVVGLSFRWNWQQLHFQAHETAANQGRDIFRMIEAMRLWNALHGGIYVVQSERTPPNPYLDVPERDPVTTSGKALTMVNPAYMTRQMSKTILEQTGIRVNITSLNPINPGNIADAWEGEALRSFERGTKERAEILDNDQSARYMAPLITQQACLSCHAKQGYKVGDIRGGISVSFSTEPIFTALLPQRRAVIAGHVAAWLILLCLTIFAMSRIRRHVGALEAARAEQEQLVEKRTREWRNEANERRQAESQLRHLVESTSGGMLGVDAEGRCIVCNPVAARILGVDDVDALYGKMVTPLLAASNPLLDGYLIKALLGEPQAEDALPLGSDPQTAVTVEVRVDPIVEGDRVMGAVLTLVDASERQARQREIWHQANFDHLTGLANRSLFLDRLERALLQDARSGRMAALFFLDLDGFKPVNDQYGHAAGDAVLVEVAHRLTSAIRSTDIAARFGGDEFVIAMTEIGAAGDVEQLAQKLLVAISAPFDITVARVSLSASIGIALFPDDSQSTESLLAAADEAMYRAKAAGKHCFCFFANGNFRIFSDNTAIDA